ncbi:MAG: CCA tRNA nucleotidyltransferase [Rhizobiaceae bacterium]
MSASIAGRAPWLADAGLQRLLAALSAGDEEARVVGGAVRNALIGQPVTDIDIATTTRPEDTSRRAEAAGFRAIPTGAEHGTITLVGDGRAYEATTLRADVETDGRHAKVVFGRDWKRDAERRDFTINALYATADGTVVDLVGGVADIESRTVRFIGDPEARIREDFLRILRFFRFFAWYGVGRPDADGLKACARLKQGLDRLSSERVWAELKKLLSAPDPTRAALWMRQASVLSRVLPESEKWGIDSLNPLVEAGKALGWPADPLLRLQTIIPPDAKRAADMAERLRLSRDETVRLVDWAETPAPKADTPEDALRRLLYRGKPQGIADRLSHALAKARDTDERAAVAFAHQLGVARTWSKPRFPVSGRDLASLGVAAGPEMGALLKTLEDAWVESDFTLDRDALIERATAGTRH